LIDFFMSIPIHAMNKRKQEEDVKPTTDGSNVDDESSGDEVYFSVTVIRWVQD
jgi:hypothetical protein